jgi:hypothetical protein
MGDISRINLLRKVPNQTLKAIYYPPKTQRDIDTYATQIRDESGYITASPDEIKNTWSEAFVDDYVGERVDDFGVEVTFKDGTEDVYVKSGYEHEIFEYLDRQFTNKRKYRVITDQTNVKFLAGGRIKFYGVDTPYYILKVINMTSDVSTQNKFRNMPYAKEPFEDAPKVIALI